jgi:hypothetical protein
MAVRQSEAQTYLALRLLYQEPRAARGRETDMAEPNMDWTLLIIGTLTALLGVLSIYLIWREKKHTPSVKGEHQDSGHEKLLPLASSMR